MSSDLTLAEALAAHGELAATTVRTSVAIPVEFTPTRDQIKAMQQEMFAHCAANGLTPRPTHPEHLFADGLYARKYAMPVGQLAVTKTHKKKHFIVCCGDATIWTDQGSKRLVGFHCFITHPGTKRVIFAHADTLFITFHATQETDLATIEAELIEDEGVTFDEVTP